MQSRPLLKFRGDEAFLVPEGLAALKALPGLICPVIFIGDGRGGKSYLASRLLGFEGTFVSSDSADPVTEGIDYVAAPVNELLANCAEGATATTVQPGEHLLVLDCEGGNNAMAAIRTLVNVFGIVLGTEVVFVANGMATEQALQNLGASLAARSLVRLDGSSKLPQQRLIFVVNKNSLRYEASALEEILDQKYDDPGRQELRDNVRAAFPERDFFAVPLKGLPGFEESIQDLRAKVLAARRPLTVGGAQVRGPQLCGLLELVVSEIGRANEVSFPSMKRLVILDGFLLPLAGRLMEEARDRMPRLEDYCEDLACLDPRGRLLASFDAESVRVAHEACLVQEARDSLQEQLSALWQEVEILNETFGEQVLRVTQEEREVMTASRKVMKGHLLKLSPCFLRQVLKIMNRHQQKRICILKDGHFLWWEPESVWGQARGCLNLFTHRAEVLPDPEQPNAFLLRPAEEGGWSEARSFTGGPYREFHFDAADGEASRDAWIKAIRRHIEFAELARQQLGPERLLKQVEVFRPSLSELDSS